MRKRVLDIYTVGDSEDLSCKGCPRRVVGCHATCGDYNEWLINHEKKKERVRKLQQYENMFPTVRDKVARC